MSNLRSKMLLFALLFNFFLALGMMCTMEGCVVDLEMDPIEIEVEIAASLECKEENLINSLTLPECVIYEPDDCCNITWSDDCYISFCSDCIGVSAPCYEQEEE